jgi:LysR family transcriptional activator of nhaA
MKWLNYHHLYYFFKIAELGTISKAAEFLRTGQPGLSSQLKELEENIGILFERRNRGLFLTDRGQIVFKYAKEIFSKGDELLSILERGELAPSKEIIVGVQEEIPKVIIAQAILNLKSIYDAKFRVIEDDPADLVESLNQGRLDLIIVDKDFSHQGGTIFYREIGGEKLGIWGSEPFKKMAKNFPHSLSGEPFIVSPLGHPLRQDLEHFFLSHELQLSPIAEISDTALIKELGAQGLGMVMLGETSVKSLVKSGRLFKLGTLPIVQKYWIGLPKRSLRDPLSEVILKKFNMKGLK